AGWPVTVRERMTAPAGRRKVNLEGCPDGGEYRTLGRDVDVEVRLQPDDPDPYPGRRRGLLPADDQAAAAASAAGPAAAAHGAAGRPGADHRWHVRHGRRRRRR